MSDSITANKVEVIFEIIDNGMNARELDTHSLNKELASITRDSPRVFDGTNPRRGIDHMIQELRGEMLSEIRRYAEIATRVEGDIDNLAIAGAGIFLRGKKTASCPWQTICRIS